MATTPTSPVFFHTPAGQETIYGYRYDCKTTGESFMYLRDFGHGMESAAQLVKNMTTGEVVIRKVVKSLCYRQNYNSTDSFRPVKPDEIEILDKVRTWPEISGVPCYISDCYNHEYVKVKETTFQGVGNLYRSVGWWRLCNGGSIHDADHPGADQNNPASLLPLVGWARYVWQIVGTLQFLGFGNPEGIPLTHRDGHPGNIFVHWNEPEVGADMSRPEALLPDFILGDFGNAKFQDPKAEPPDTWPREPGITKDIGHVEINLEAVLQGLGILDSAAKKIEGGLENARPTVRKLHDIYQAICDITHQDKGNMNVYPDLMHIVQMGKEMEDMCLQDAELMAQPSWEQFAVARRAKALALSMSVPFISLGTQEQAMKPIDPATGNELLLYEPWAVCALGWKMVQGHPIPPTDPRAHTQNGPKDVDWYGTPSVFNLLHEIKEDPSRAVYACGEGENGRKTKGKRIFDGILGSSRDRLLKPSFGRRQSADVGTKVDDFLLTHKLDWRPEALKPQRNKMVNRETQTKFLLPPVATKRSMVDTEIQTEATIVDAETQTEIIIMMVDAEVQTEAPTNQPATDESGGDIRSELAEMSEIINGMQEELERIKEVEGLQRRLHTFVHGDECQCDKWPTLIEDMILLTRMSDNSDQCSSTRDSSPSSNNSTRGRQDRMKKSRIPWPISIPAPPQTSSATDGGAKIILRDPSKSPKKEDMDASFFAPPLSRALSSVQSPTAIATHQPWMPRRTSATFQARKKQPPTKATAPQKKQRPALKAPESSSRIPQPPRSTASAENLKRQPSATPSPQKNTKIPAPRGVKRTIR